MGLFEPRLVESLRRPRYSNRYESDLKDKGRAERLDRNVTGSVVLWCRESVRLLRHNPSAAESLSHDVSSQLPAKARLQSQSPASRSRHNNLRLCPSLPQQAPPSLSSLVTRPCRCMPVTPLVIDPDAKYPATGACSDLIASLDRR